MAGRSHGHHLSPQGLQEAERLAVGLTGLRIAAVLSSPLERARETAAAIAAPHRLDVTVDPGLTEFDFGQWTGSAFDTLHHAPGWAEFNLFRSCNAPPGGEGMLQVQARMVQAAINARERWPDGEVVLVSHGDPIKALLLHFLGMPLDLFRRIEIFPASRSIIRLDRNDARVEGINLPPGS